MPTTPVLRPTPRTKVVVHVDGTLASSRALTWALGEGARRGLPVSLLHLETPCPSTQERTRARRRDAVWLTGLLGAARRRSAGDINAVLCRGRLDRVLLGPTHALTPMLLVLGAPQCGAAAPGTAAVLHRILRGRWPTPSVLVPEGDVPEGPVGVLADDPRGLVDLLSTALASAEDRSTSLLVSYAGAALDETRVRRALSAARLARLALLDTGEVRERPGPYVDTTVLPRAVTGDGTASQCSLLYLSAATARRDGARLLTHDATVPTAPLVVLPPRRLHLHPAEHTGPDATSLTAGEDLHELHDLHPLDHLDQLDHLNDLHHLDAIHDLKDLHDLHDLHDLADDSGTPALTSVELMRPPRTRASSRR